jgi:1,4-alpha-glucan branching enzyme
MPGYLSLVLHAHLPFVRHPEHERFLEENWLFEAITESYIPLLQILAAWQRDHVPTRLTLTLTPTVCAMLQDPLLQGRYRRHLDELVELAGKEIHRTLWQQPMQELARFYRDRFETIRSFYLSCAGDVVGAFREHQEAGQLEIITSAATHALLPLLARHPPSVRAQIRVARDEYRRCFGRDPAGIWLPECAYFEGLETVLHEAGLRWFITDTHGILHARPRPRYAHFAPLFTPNGVAAFGRDVDSARQVWSRDEGYPGDPRYRDFYRDIGFDLDLDYLRPYLPAPEQPSFTGFKYHRITHRSGDKEIYQRPAALRAADEHASHFLDARVAQIRRLSEILDRPPLVVSPYDAELLGHWWYEGPEFLDLFVRKAAYDQQVFTLITPSDYLRLHPSNQVATPAASSWGEKGYWEVWLNEKNEWIYPHLQVAQERMSELVRSADGKCEVRGARGEGRGAKAAVLERALRQAGRELLLAQSSDWPFILRTGTSPEYAARRVKEHLLRFTRTYEQLKNGAVDEQWLATIEAADNLFPELDYRYWLSGDAE